MDINSGGVLKLDNVVIANVLVFQLEDYSGKDRWPQLLLFNYK